MSTINIYLPDTSRGFVERQVAGGGYGTSSEYVRELIRRNQERLKLRALLLDGAECPVSGEAGDDYFAKLRRRVTPAKPSRRRL